MQFHCLIFLNEIFINCDRTIKTPTLSQFRYLLTGKKIKTKNVRSMLEQKNKLAKKKKTSINSEYFKIHNPILLLNGIRTSDSLSSRQSSSNFTKKNWLRVNIGLVTEMKAKFILQDP